MKYDQEVYEALAENERNKPVAWMVQYKGKHDFSFYKPVSHDDAVVIPLYTHPVKEQEIEKLIGDLRNVAKAQGQKGCWDFDQYMLGLFNGLELALSIFEKREPQYRELPPHPVKELTEQAEKDIRHAISCYFDDSTIYGYELSNRIIAILRKAQEK